MSPPSVSSTSTPDPVAHASLIAAHVGGWGRRIDDVSPADPVPGWQLPLRHGTAAKPKISRAVASPSVSARRCPEPEAVSLSDLLRLRGALDVERGCGRSCRYELAARRGRALRPRLPNGAKSPSGILEQDHAATPGVQPEYR